MPPAEAFALLVLLAAGTTSAHAASTTQNGQVSVAQVMELAFRAQAEPEVRMTLIAYLWGLGEATGIVASEAEARSGLSMNCSGSFSLDTNAAIAALTAAAPERSNWTETAATPIIIEDMFRRANCR
jgi:hypothetical protein